MQKIRQAVILAGGLGRRMLPLTLTTPKPMIRINGKPFLAYLIDLLKENNIKEVLILVGYLHQIIEEYFKDGSRYGLSIKYSYSPAEADTGTRIRDAYPLLDRKFLLLYGDNYWPLQLNNLTDAYPKMNKKAMVTVYSNIDKSTKNNMHVNNEGLVDVYDRKRSKENLNYVDIGFFIMDKSILKDLPKYNLSFEDYILPKLIKEKQLGAYITNHKYYGLSNKERIPIIEDYFRQKKIVFLDRDGVINKRPPKASYVTHWKEFVFLPGAIEALRRLTKNGYDIYIISNQAGISRGIMTYKQVDDVNNRMKKELRKQGIEIADIFICPHGWDENCFCRKPNPGLLYLAASKNHLDLYSSYCIGDDLRDIQAGKSAGCKTIYVGTDVKMSNIKSNQKPDFICKDLYHATNYL